MRDRYYSSELHRFLSLDKDQGDLYRPSTLNPYAYVGNASINFIDPSGMVAVEIGSAIKQVLLGDLLGEFTLVGMVARIGSSFFGFDILGDIGDLVDSLIYFDFSLEAFVNLGINTIGLLPVFGVVKNVKYVDKAIDSVKGLGKGAYQLRKRTIGGATKFALKAGVKVADYAKTGYKAASNAVGIGLDKASSFFGVSSTKRLASGADTANDARKALKNVDEVGSGAKLATNATDTVETFTEEELKHLHKRLEELADEKLLPKYRAEDPDLVAGYKGSFQTGKVRNKRKARYGQPIDRNGYDIDYWIESDILYKKKGEKLKVDPDFRKILAKEEDFKGLRKNKDGFSIKFNPKGGR